MCNAAIKTFALSFIAQDNTWVMQGLHFLHSNKVAHRDLKTKNILLNTAGVAKIGDLGLAKLVGNQLLSTQLETAGTFAYAAPELLMGEPSDTRAELFSFGVIMWEASSPFLLHQRYCFSGYSLVAARLTPFLFLHDCPILLGKLNVVFGKHFQVLFRWSRFHSSFPEDSHRFWCQQTFKEGEGGFTVCRFRNSEDRVS